MITTSPSEKQTQTKPKQTQTNPISKAKKWRSAQRADHFAGIGYNDAETNITGLAIERKSIKYPSKIAENKQ